jgi:hypothetical protein
MLIKSHQKQHAAAHRLAFDIGFGLALGIVDVFAGFAGERGVMLAGFCETF